MIHLFADTTADQVWQRATQHLMSQDTPLQPGRGGSTKEILHAVFEIQNPQQKWVYSRVPAMNPAFAIAEIVWILRGRNDAAFLSFWNNQLSKYVGDSQIYHGAYGFRIRRHFGIDQLERAYSVLLNNPDGRQVVLQIWDALQDLPTEQGLPVNTDIPCNIMSILKVRDNYLDWVQINRSNDLFRGVPYNFVQFTTLQEVMAGWLGLEIGSYLHFSDSLHLYEKDTKNLTMLSVPEPVNCDSLRFPKADSDRYFTIIESQIEKMISPTLTYEYLTELVNQSEMPLAFENFLLIVAAECARRKRWIDYAHKLSERCTNPMLLNLWNNWTHRLEQKY